MSGSETRIKLGSAFDPRMIPDSAWVFRGYSGDGAYRVYTYTDRAMDITIEKKEYVLEDALREWNRHEFEDTATKKWRDDTAIGQRVSRIPLHLFYKDFANRHDDPDYTKWWHAQEQNQPFLTKKGKL
jgi:hypothetical protein